MGQGVSVLVNVRLSRQAPSDIDAFMAAIHRLPEITECLLVTGNVDYVLKVQTKDTAALRDFVLKELKTIPSVSETSTTLILDVVKSLTLGYSLFAGTPERFSHFRRCGVFKR